MNENGNAPAYPQPASPAGYRAKWSDGFGGLSKREHMATEAMKGMISNQAVLVAALRTEEGGQRSAEHVLANGAVVFADALLEALEPTQITDTPEGGED